MTDVLFTGLRHPVRFIRCPELLRPAQDFFHAWPFTLCAAPAHAAPLQIASCGKPDAGYDISAPWLKAPLHEPTAASALCSLSIELVAAFCEEHEMLCLHAAAVSMANEYLLLLGGNHAGKSTLVARLMADSWTSCGDDLVGMTAKGELFSFGIAPPSAPPSPALCRAPRLFSGPAGHRRRPISVYQSRLPLFRPLRTYRKTDAHPHAATQK